MSDAVRGRAAIALAVLALVGCARQEQPPSPAPRPPRSLHVAERTASVRLAGELHRQVAAHATIPVVLEASCPDLASFLLRRTLDVDAAVSGTPGRSFRGKVTHVHRTHAVTDPVPADHVYGLITVDVDNPGGVILPGRLVAASFGDRHGSPLVLFGVAGEPEGDAEGARALALGQAR
jgi:hypothetical protein